MKEYLDACCCCHNYEHKMAPFHYKNWRGKHRGFQCTRARQMPVTDAMVFMCSVLGSFGYLVQSGPVIPQSNAWLLCTVRGAVKCPARAGGCSLRAGRKKSKHAIDQFCVSLFQFFLFCLDKEVWKRGLMAICSTNLSFEHPFNKGMLQ